MRREGEGLEKLPFIDSMMQNYDSEDKVMYTCEQVLCIYIHLWVATVS